MNDDVRRPRRNGGVGKMVINLQIAKLLTYVMAATRLAV